MSKADRHEITWRKSSHSSGNGQCVEVNADAREIAVVRDSKEPIGIRLRIQTEAWDEFISGVKTASLIRANTP
ncbi:DUF397 domain-containing protein [Streptomyces mobaraensis NBRC 13819 = DSM 40847]|uniref:Uncharacterized protein n=1 Tax=Streptomyces mobaraensis (strain ATCC 29032 / DSM 40847 / JCM 4168 / NBRC 13819 / NCIMB 11159 / IPCR 16-22) TaxID=1223523 RepID=M3BRM7_STRM1|nr:DUF397 domain-containing protein [Streptomyces mobaraensis]EMF02350.1 hypothetical protein H340_00839 [Streptomyces mobaraensis NBRC 13819 = DSM 40847]QTT78170.1 DUF397 domain-containing protein [Streptomyces mobaraensis NBRC 13819 = DSM 40847]